MAYSFNGTNVRNAAYGFSYQGPGGQSVFQTNHHTSWGMYAVNAVGGDRYEPIVSSTQLQAPDPYKDFGSTAREYMVCDYSSTSSSSSDGQSSSGAVTVRGAKLITQGIGVGLMHDVRGVGRQMLDAELLAIDEINAVGGVMGKQLLPIVIQCNAERAEQCMQTFQALSGKCASMRERTLSSARFSFPYVVAIPTTLSVSINTYLLL